MTAPAEDTRKNGKNPARILLVEDSTDDVLLIEEALRQTCAESDVRIVGDGEAAMDFLHRRGRYVDEPRPDIVLLDLNLPKKGGMEVLAELRNDPRLCALPVIVLTTSYAERDIARAYDKQANAYLTKPIDVDDFIRVVRSIEDFYLHTARLPGAEPSRSAGSPAGSATAELTG
jgi:CheY-like chemotaxis protein